MKEVKIKDISYEDFINEDRVFAMVQTYYILDKKNPFFVIYNDEACLKLSTNGKVIDYIDNNTFFIFDSLTELGKFINNIVDEDNIYAWAYYNKKAFENKEEFESYKKSNRGIVSFFYPDKVYQANFDINKFDAHVVNSYLIEDLLAIKESLNHIIDIYETGEIEPYISKSTYIATLKETINDFKNLLRKLNSIIVNNTQVTSIIDYIKRYVEEVNYDDLLDSYKLALEIANELKIR